MARRLALSASRLIAATSLTRQPRRVAPYYNIDDDDDDDDDDDEFRTIVLDARRRSCFVSSFSLPSFYVHDHNARLTPSLVLFVVIGLFSPLI
jgi:hypothetical protein